MAGHYGAATSTVRGLKIVKADAEKNIVLIRGAVPGPDNGLLRIEKQG
jgi:large subunit ribosomal protein L3